MNTAPALPLPSPRLRETPFWQALTEARISVQRCADCGCHRFPDAPVCAACRSERSERVDIPGRGRILAWCRFHKTYFPNAPIPYAVLLVELEHGIRMYANFAHGHAETRPEIGMMLEPVFESLDANVVKLCFRPAGAPRPTAASNP